MSNPFFRDELERAIYIDFQWLIYDRQSASERVGVQFRGKFFRKISLLEEWQISDAAARKLDSNQMPVS
ncbi:hypothetical protein [Beijerinckia mobilis]|uniref:hypothetical protein n=1 Tax=Beijerinckia mobilis TaxID=231434 RepID=UPI0005513F9D|nr:hypothetical protein [Beijerinckia mobilis]